MSTTWEVLYGTKPDVSNMRMFGVRAYALIPKQLRDKLPTIDYFEIKQTL